QSAPQAFGCSLNTVQAAQIRLESATELLPDLTVLCTGSANSDIYGDVLVEVKNTTFTSRRLDSLTAVDAVLLINDGSPILGIQAANNVIRFPNVLIAPGNQGGSRTFKLKNLRLDGTASAPGTAFPVVVSIQSQGTGVAVANSQQTAATSAAS